MDLKNMTLEEKVDLLVEYQIKAVRMARLRMIGSIVLFFLLVVLPVILFAQLMKSVDIMGTFGKINENINALNDATGTLDNMSDMTNSLNELLGN